MTKFKTITILVFLLLSIFSGCKNTKEEETVSPTTSVSSAQFRTTAWVDGAYTRASTTYSFSIRKFTDCPPTPLIIAFHGGGFTNGAKESMIPNALNTAMNINILTEAQLEQQGIAYAIPNYGLLNSNYTGVRNPLDDCKAFVEYMHENAATYNIDPNKIILMGFSAGASAALWIGLQAQPGVKGIVAISPQANLNILQWGGQIFAPFGQLNTFTNNFSTLSNAYIKEIYGTTNQVQIQAYSVNNQLNFFNLIDNSDPELYLASITTTPDDILHHACHVYALKQKADEKGLTARIQFTSNPLYVNNAYPEGVIQFCVRKFN